MASAAVRDVKVLQQDGTWQSIMGRPGKDAGITKAEFDKLEARLKEVEQKLEGLDTYEMGQGIDIKSKP